MNIHFLAGVRIPTPRGHKVSKEGTKPRVRENGICGKALKRLAARQREHDLMRDTSGYTRPGSMTK